jgi:2-succinyl-5-enolpyruvyl-6-hydroxy-3-cyclohexene-1-carboxylate synthase
MTDIKLQNEAFYRAVVFLRELDRYKLKHIVLSPGSRSTPLTLAAATLPGIEKYIILDERSAAFTALGIGKTTRSPAALICTSGTAVANYFPAVIESRKSGVPLLLLTADRPPRLHHSGANQTIDQQKIFGSYPVFFRDIGKPPADEKNIKYLQRLARQSVHFSQSRQGPVHLNFPFSKPLEPEQEFIETICLENEKLNDEHIPVITENQAEKSSFGDDTLQAIHEAERPLIIIGQLTAKTTLQPIFDLAEVLQAPVLSEQGIINAALGIQGFGGFLGSNKEQLKPDLIIRFGREPASKPLLQAIRRWTPKRHLYLSDSGEWSDIAHSAIDFIEWNGNGFNTEKLPQKPRTWLEQWKSIEERYAEKLATVIAKQKVLTDGHIYHHLTPLIPDDWNVFISNSFPARDHSMFGRWNNQQIFTNRGASGIDGITSTAMGVNIGSNQPGILFTGDLAFLHDSNALLNHASLRQPLIIVVINNQGGSVFRMLPIADHKKYFSAYFETPQQADITALAQSYGVHTQKIQTIDQLKQLDPASLAAKSATKLCVIECVTDPETSMKLRNELWDSAL